MLTSAISQSMRQKVKSEPLKVKRKAGYTMGKTHATVTLLLLRKPYFPFKSQNATQHLPLESAFTDQRGQGGQGGRQGEAPAGPEGGQSRAEARGASWPACPRTPASRGVCLSPGQLWGLQQASIFLYVPCAHRKVREKSTLGAKAWNTITFTRQLCGCHGERRSCRLCSSSSPEALVGLPCFVLPLII